MIPSHKLRNLKLSEVQIPQLANPLASHLELSVGEAQLEDFRNYVHQGSQFLQSRNELEAHHRTLRNFRVKFDHSFNLWRSLLATFRLIPNYPGKLLDLLHLGMWDTAYANDPMGSLTLFGPWLAPLGQIMGGARISVFRALVQQISHPEQENLRKAQALAVEMYNHFLKFADANNLENLKMDRDDPPLLQLYAGGGVTWFSGLPVPTLIALDQAKAHRYAGFSAVPHEFGHDLSGTFNEGALAASIQQQIRSLDLKHRDFWEMWVEEAFADAIGVATIGEGEIYSLANLFSNAFTNIIFTDESGQRPDEHPNRHIRVLLTIEVGRLLGIDKVVLDRMQTKWIDFGKTKNTLIPSAFIFDQFNERLLPVEEFIEGIGSVANALVHTAYDELKGKKVKDIFADFSSELADELRDSIDKERWT